MGCVVEAYDTNAKNALLTLLKTKNSVRLPPPAFLLFFSFFLLFFLSFVVPDHTFKREGDERRTFLSPENAMNDILCPEPTSSTTRPRLIQSGTGWCLTFVGGLQCLGGPIGSYFVAFRFVELPLRLHVCMYVLGDGAFRPKTKHQEAHQTRLDTPSTS